VKVDLLGYSIMDFAHPCDHEEVYELLNDKSCTAVADASLALINDMLVTKHRTLFVRIKCTLTSKGRNINIKSAAYRVCVCDRMQCVLCNPNEDECSQITPPQEFVM